MNLRPRFVKRRGLEVLNIFNFFFKNPSAAPAYLCSAPAYLRAAWLIWALPRLICGKVKIKLTHPAGAGACAELGNYEQDCFCLIQNQLKEDAEKYYYIP